MKNVCMKLKNYKFKKINWIQNTDGHKFINTSNCFVCIDKQYFIICKLKIL